MARWYIIHAYSGFENKVKEAILAEAERRAPRKHRATPDVLHMRTLYELVYSQ